MADKDLNKNPEENIMNIAIEIEQELYERAQKEAEIKHATLPNKLNFGRVLKTD